MTHRRLAWLLALACAVVPLASASAASAVQLVPFVDVTAPTYVTSPPGDRHRLFVTSKFGDVRVVRDGVLQPTAFLDIQPDVVAASEQGLSSIAFAPDYATSGRFYVDYTAHRPGDSTGSILTVKEFRRSAASPDLADPTSGRTLLTVDHPVFDDHNAGQLRFGSDGMLYVSTGDGGDANDPPNNAQNRGSLLGKILRIDPRATSMAAYGIPADNPFVGVPGARPEVYDYGLRNPWRFSFDPATGDMLIGDVGQGAREEVDYAPSGDTAGIDYGWRCMEGSIHARGLAHPCKPTGRYVGPILEYRHTQGCAVIGGVVARDLDLRGLYGRYLYGDFCTGEIRSLVPTGPRAAGDRATGLNVDGIDAFGEDSCGHVYATSTKGHVYRIAGTAGATGCPAPGDMTAPGLELHRKKVQHLGTSDVLSARVRCGERCGALLWGTLVVPGAARPYRLVPANRVLGGGAPVVLRVDVPAGAAAAARRALAHGKSVHASLRAVVRDASGNQRVKRAGVQVAG